MQEIDRTAIDRFKIPRLLLMDHAGLALAHAASALRSGSSATAAAAPATGSPQRASPILLCCGTGYNGGDGLSAARHLHAWGIPLHVLVAGRRAQLRDEPATYATILERLGVSLAECLTSEDVEVSSHWMSDASVIIDALLGIGMRGPVREPIRSLIDRMNCSGKPIVAADIPSGLDGDSGHPQGIAVKAAVTVAFGSPKQGCFMHEGPAHAGALTVDPITLPRALLEAP